MKPKRIQRKRTRGWQMPPNTVYVGRPTLWGNPYRIGRDGNAIMCVFKYHIWINCEDQDPTLNRWRLAFLREVRRKLKGKNLACWCPLDQPCHADVLLKVANSPPKKPYSGPFVVIKQAPKA